MSFNRRPTKSSLRGIARLAASLLIGLLTIAMPTQAQTQTFQGPVCAVPPTPQENDGWPYAATDSLGAAAGPVSFAGSYLLANDRGMNLSIVRVASTGSAGGTITGTDPYTYTPPPAPAPPAPAATGDVFTYEISDTAGQTAVGIVKVGLIPDIVNPSVNISAPAADSTVSGIVTIEAVASDNVGVERVQFFVDDVQIGNDLTAPYSVSWDSRSVADGPHTFSALARDAAGNPGASPAIGVNVRNAAATVAVPTVVGLTQTAAQTAITAAGLAVGTVTPTSSSVPAGQVITQSPTGGVSVAIGSSVALTVSTGPATAAVPGVVGKTQAAAQSAITAAGFAVGAVSTANSVTVAAGLVITQSPTAGTSAVLGSSVGFTVSLGPASAAVPDVVGKTQTAAQSAITSAGFGVGAIATANSATVAAGLVISQNPTAGTSALLGSSVGFTVSLGPAATPPPANGLVLALGFDEASGTVATDSSSSAKNGAIREAVRVPGKFGSALKFDGVNDWVTVTDTTASPLDLTSGLTLEAWVNPAQMSGWETVMYKERGIAGEGLLCYALYARDGAPEPSGTPGPAGYMRLTPVASTADSGVRGATAIPLNAWTHLATTYDGTSQRFYVNGVLVKSVVSPGAIVQSNGALRIGGNNSSFYEFFQGLIDEVRVYNRALSATEITTDMNTAIVR